MAPRKQGAVLPINKGSTDREDATAPGHDEQLADDYINNIRTDLNRFTDAEIGILENHGYLMANRVIKKRAPQLVEGDWPPLRPPHRKLFDSRQVRQVLAYSDCRTWIGRLWKRVKGWLGRVWNKVR